MTAQIVEFKRKPKKIDDSDEKLPPPSDADLVGFIRTLDFLLNQGASESITLELSLIDLSIAIRQYHDVDEDTAITSGSALEFITAGEFDIETESTEQLIVTLKEMFKRIDIDYYSNKHPEEKK
jgi:hypothetical protein